MDPSGYRMSLGGRVNAARGRAGSASPDPDPDPEPPAPLPPESPLVAPALPAPPAGFVPPGSAEERSVFSSPPGYWFPSYHLRPSCSDLRAGRSPPAAASAAATRNGSRSAAGSLSTLGKRFFFSPPDEQMASFSVLASSRSFASSSRKPSSSAASPSSSSSSPSSSPSPAARTTRFSVCFRSASGDASAGDIGATGGIGATAVHVGSSSSASSPPPRAAASLWFRNRSSLRCASKSTACSISANVARRLPPSPLG